MTNTPKPPRDQNQLAKFIADLATGDRTETRPPESEMAELGREGGKAGGNARAATLTPEQRSEIARKAAAAR